MMHLSVLWVYIVVYPETVIMACITLVSSQEEERKLGKVYI